MGVPAPWYRWDGNALVLNIHLQPRANSDEIVGPHGDRLKIRITAPPTDGRANTALIAFLARVFKVQKSSVVLLSGQGSRQKCISIRSPRRLLADIRARD